ncbi:hypothetical protein AGDE_06472 [Angomonas deanei]|nr:hypothetical protein AGDE_06472 [Angomonas deanei]|eukprot:EPY37462.1 hypothetical protein AGDE_06472 [Angomonas deanei]
MKKFAEGVFQSFAPEKKLLRSNEKGSSIFYSLLAHRWHFDTRESSKIIAIHDFCSSNAYWHQQLNGALADLPLERLVPSKPLEVYCVDLRGHNFSSTVPVQSTNYALACAADVVRFHEEVVVSPACVSGVGFGAMVGVCAALNKPEAFTHAVFFVRSLAELFEGHFEGSGLRSVLKDFPSDCPTLTEANTLLKSKVPNANERALLLSCCETKKDRVRLRVNRELFDLPSASVKSYLEDGCVFTNPTTVYLLSSETVADDENAALFQKHFPNGTVKQLSSNQTDLFTHSLLGSCDLLQDLQEQQ